MHVNIESTCCISTLSINCRSISKKIENIECSLKSLDNKFDFVGLTEAWLKPNDNSDIYNLPDYTLLSRPRTGKRGGGVGLYVGERLSIWTTFTKTFVIFFCYNRLEQYLLYQ